MKGLLQCFVKMEQFSSTLKLVKSANKDKLNFIPCFSHILDIINDKNNNPNINIDNYNKDITIFINKVYSYYNGPNKGLKPLDLYLMIFEILEKESNMCLNDNKSLSFENYKDIDFKIEEGKKLKILNDIAEFEKKQTSPIIDYFSFLFIEYIKCLNCRVNLDAKVETNKFINLKPQNNNDLISNLIDNYFVHNSMILNNTIKCNYCGMVLKNYNPMRYLLKFPKYLVFEIEGNNKVKLENKIDISNYRINNTGAKEYKLFAVIVKNNFDNYSSMIRENNNFILFIDDLSQNYDREKLNNNMNDYTSLVIYEKNE